MRILLIRLSSLGDIVLTQPVVQVLRSHYPRASIEYLTKKPYRSIVEAFGDVDQIHNWENKKVLLNKLKKHKYDLIIDLHRKFNSLVIKTCLRSKKTITYNKRHCYRWLITKKLIKTPNESTTNLYLKTLEKIELSYKDIKPQLNTFSFLDEDIDDLFKEKKIDRTANLVGIFPGALHRTKQYPVKSYCKFINSIPDEWNCQFLILGSENDKIQKIQNIKLSTSAEYWI